MVKPHLCTFINILDRNQLFIDLLYYFHPYLTISSNIFLTMEAHVMIQFSNFGSFIAIFFLLVQSSTMKVPKRITSNFTHKWGCSWKIKPSCSGSEMDRVTSPLVLSSRLRHPQHVGELWDVDYHGYNVLFVLKDLMVPSIVCLKTQLSLLSCLSWNMAQCSILHLLHVCHSAHGTSCVLEHVTFFCFKPGGYF